VEGVGPHQVNIPWHLGATLRSENSAPHVFSNNFVSIGLLSVAGHGWSQSVTREYCSSPYGTRVGASVVTFGTQTRLPTDFVTLLVANDRARLDLGQLVRLNELTVAMPCGYRYHNSRAEHVFFFAARQGSWTLDGWGSDAEFLWCSLDPARDAYTFVLCNGSYVDAEGRRVLTCGKRVSYVEVVSSSGKSEVLSPNAESVVLDHAVDKMWTDRDAAAPIHNPKRVGM
jgi:hypothetical protein